MTHTLDSHHTKRISYILLTKNRAPLLKGALGRMRPFLAPADEVIIIDAASSDGTREVIEENRDIIDISVSEPDVPGEAMNKGVLLARGKYVKQVSDDEALHYEKLASAIDVLEVHPEIDVLVCGGTMYFDNKNETKPLPIYVPPEDGFGRHPDDVFRHWAVAGACLVIRRSVFAKVGLFSPTIVNDFEFVVRCIAGGACVRFCRINLFENHANTESTTFKQKGDVYKEKKLITKKYCSRSVYLLYLLKKSSLTRRLKLAALYDPLSKALWRYRRHGAKALFFGARKQSGVSHTPQWDGGIS